MRKGYDTIRYDTIEVFNVDSNAEDKDKDKGKRKYSR